MTDISKTAASLQAARVAHAKAMKPVLAQALAAVATIDTAAMEAIFNNLPDGEPVKIHLQSVLTAANHAKFSLKQLSEQNDQVIGDA